jgi:hypothetical protein
MERSAAVIQRGFRVPGSGFRVKYIQNLGVRIQGARYRKQTIFLAIIVALAAIFFMSALVQAETLEWRIVRRGRFIARFTQRTSMPEVERVFDLCDAAAKKLDKYFGKQMRFRPEFVIYPSTRDYTATTGSPWWHAATWRDGNVHLQPPQVLRERDMLATTLTHELTHAALDQAVGPNEPLWFDEGLAAMMSGEFDAEYTKNKKSFIWKESLAALEAAMTQTKDKDLAGRAYKSSYAFVRFLHNKYGKNTILALYKKTADSSDFSGALKKTFKADATQLFKIWRNSL